jgi:uncharacterized protein YjaZ
MSSSLTTKFSSNGKAMHAFCISLHDEGIPDWISAEIQQAFEALAPYIKNEEQVLYIRDIPSLAIDSKFPGGHCYNEYAAMVALTAWADARRQIIATINHELHHMARWQNPGYGETLGGALLSEGIATYYQELISGWTPPWAKAEVSQNAIKGSLKQWDAKDYNHSEWFFQGPHGRWVGYGLGYRLAQKIFADGFDLAKSVTIQPSEARELLKTLSSAQS